MADAACAVSGASGRDRRHARAEAKMATTVEDGARALATLLVGRYGYDGDRLRYDDPQNADFITVIDRGAGCPWRWAFSTCTRRARRASRRRASTRPDIFSCGSRSARREALIDPFNGGAALERESLGAPPAHGHAGCGRQPPGRDRRRCRCAAASRKQSQDARVADGRTHARARNRQAHGADRAAPSRFVDRSGRASTKRPARSARRRKPSRPVFRWCRPATALHNEAALGLHALKRRLN